MSEYRESAAAGTMEKLLLAYARRFPIRRGKLRAVDALWRVAVDPADTKRTARLKYGGLTMPCDLTEMLQRQFYFFGTYFVEEHIIDCWRTEAGGARVVFDIGANAGLYSIVALAANDAATVHAFEPTPEIAERLRVTARQNRLPTLHVHELAVSDASGSAVLHRFRGELGTNEGMNYISPDAASGDASEVVGTVSVDDFCAARDIAHIDLMKLDIQGHEHKALDGARAMLRSPGPMTVFTELNWSRDGSACPAEAVVATLESAGFDFADPRQSRIRRPRGAWLRELDDVIARRTS